MQYRQYVAGAAGTTTTSTMDIRQDDTISQVVLDSTALAPGDGDTFYLELSWQSTPSQTVNDVSNVIASMQFNAEAGAAGTAIIGKTFTIEPSLKVFQGERLYLHAVNTGAGTTKSWAHIVTNKEAPRSASRR